LPDTNVTVLTYTGGSKKYVVQQNELAALTYVHNPLVVMLGE